MYSSTSLPLSSNTYLGRAIIISHVWATTLTNISELPYLLLHAPILVPLRSLLCVPSKASQKPSKCLGALVSAFMIPTMTLLKPPKSLASA